MSVVLKKGRGFDSLNIIPLIDVVFFLLCFFLIAARIEEEDRELPVQLPTAKSAVPMTMEPQIMTVVINHLGQFVIDGKNMLIEEIEIAIRQAVIDNPVNQTVIIRGDRRVPFQYVVSVMDICQKLKVPSYKVTTSGLESAENQESQ